MDWEIFVRTHANGLFRTALAILGNHAEAEDAVQDTFLKYLEKAPKDVANPGGWLTRVLVNGCKSRLRLKWRQVTALPEDLAATGLERAELEELWQLPPKDRAVIHLFYYEGYSTVEIAAMTGEKAGTVRSRMSRARGKLRTLLEDAV